MKISPLMGRFRGTDQLARIVEEAQAIVNRTIAAGSGSTEGTSST